MPTTLTKQATSRTGLNPAYSNADAGGNDFVNLGTEMVIVKNDDASSKTVTFETTATIDGQAVSDPQVAVPAGELRIVGPFRPAYYNTAGGKLVMTFSAVTNLKVAIIDPGPT
jgi:hypothetical protein